MLQISHKCCKFQPNTSCSCFQQYFPFLFGRENLQNYLNSLPVLIILLNPLPVLVALKILREILSLTCSFMVNTRLLVWCLKISDRKVKEFLMIPRIASSRLVYVLYLNVSGSATVTPDLYRETVTQQTLH